MATRDSIKKIINLAFQQENISLHNYQITVLNPIGAKNFRQEAKVSHGNTDGKSAGSAIYLALVSSLYQIPISRSVAATGRIAGGTKTARTVEGKEINLSAGDNLPIGGLKVKITGAIQQGVNRFVLSKYQCSPYLLSLKHKNKWYDDAGKFHVEKK